MKFQNHNSNRSILPCVVGSLVITIIFTAACSPSTRATEPPSSAPGTVEATPLLPTAPPPTLTGEKFDVDGFQLFLYCTGAGSPTVILEAGLQGDDLSWKQVQPDVAQFTRVCSYDRA